MQIDPSTLQRWKTGDTFPELPNIERLAKVLGVSEREFYTSDEPIVKTLPMSAMTKRLSSVPDEVYELASELGVNDEVWEDVIETLMIAVEDKKLNKKG